MSERLSMKQRWLLDADTHVSSSPKEGPASLRKLHALGLSNMLTQQSHCQLLPSILMLTVAAQINVRQPRAGDGEEGIRWDEAEAGKSGNTTC